MKSGQAGLSGAKWGKTGPNGAKWCQMVPNRVKQGQTGSNGAKKCLYSFILSHGSKFLGKALFGPIWPRSTLFGTIWHNLTLFGPAWPHLALLGHSSIFISRYFKLRIRQGADLFCGSVYMVFWVDCLADSSKWSINVHI